MRFNSLILHRYGNYEAERISFDPRPGTVNVLLAPNSAGKSVLRAAVTDLLFGIGNQTPMGFRFGYPGMRMTADITRRDGSRFVFSRRKTRGNAIVDDNDQLIDPAFLHGILGGRDRAFLERLFVLDTETLRGGGKALLETDGDVASALLSAAGGIREARLLKQRLEKQRDELAPQRKVASRPFYKALDQFQDARGRIRTATLRPEEWSRQQNERDTLEAQRRERNAEAETASAEIARLERVRRVRPILERHARAVEWLALHPDAPVLPPDLWQALSAARVDVTTKDAMAERARDDLAKAEQDARAVTFDAVLLAHAEQIERLTGEAGAARKARDDFPGVSGQHAHGLARMEHLLRQLGSPLPPDRAIEAAPTRMLRARALKLIKDHGEILRESQTAAARIDTRARDLADIEQRLNAHAPAADVRPLESLLETIRADGNPAARMAELAKALTLTEAALEAAHAHVPGWTGDAAALAALRPLTPEMYRGHAAVLTAAREAVTIERQRYEDEHKILDQARARLAAIPRGGAIPDQAAQMAARARRDSLWRLIYRRAFTDDPASPAEEQAHTADLPLPLAFERGIHAADAIADQRFAEADVIARVETARHTVMEAEQRAEAATERLRLTQEKLDQARREWRQICEKLPLGDEPGLADIQTFLTAREKAIEARTHHALAAEAVAVPRQRHALWAEALGVRLDHASTDLMLLLALADKTLAEARARQQERNDLDIGHRQATREMLDARAARDAAEHALTQWRARWSTVLADLGRPEHEEPAETEAMLQALDEIAAEHGATARLAERIAGMNTEIARFTQEVQTLARALPSLPPHDDPFDTIRALGLALNRERALEQRSRVLEETVVNTRIAAQEGERALEEANTRLGAILDLTGAATAEAAEQRLLLSAARTQYKAARDGALLDAREAGDGFSLDALRVEVEQIPAEEVTARIDAAAAVREEAHEAAQAIASQASALKARMDQQETEATLNAASADQQSALASLSRTLDEALVYHTASLLLGKALESVERSGDSAMLHRLGTIFQSLTNGAYARVATEMNESGTARLELVQRDFPDERQSIAQLSEGTRDQFFLALRVAAIEDHLTGAEPLPFMGDDILQTFDDDRALAALRVLADLGQRTQVIVLTHHRHVLDLAARLPEGTIFPCQRETLSVTV